MPPKPFRKCNKAGCGNITRNGYCDEHEEYAKQLKAERAKRYDKTIRTNEDNHSYNAFYKSAGWIAMRSQIKRRDLGLCQNCLKENRIVPMDVVDHIVELRDDFSLRLTASNLLSLCHSCHNKKSAIEKAKRNSKM